MAATVITILPATDFNFRCEANQGIKVPIGPMLDTTSWVSGVLLVRLHSKGTWISETAFFAITLSGTLPAPNESTIYEDVSNAAIIIANADAAPRLYTQALAPPIGQYMQGYLTWVQGGSLGSSPFSISVVVVGRDA